MPRKTFALCIYATIHKIESPPTKIMPSKNDYIRRILNSHGIIIDFEGTPRKTNIPKESIKDETFKKWKDRVLGQDVTNVVCYGPIKYDQRTKIDRIKEEANASHIKTILRTVKRTEKTKKEEAITKEKEEANKKAITIPLDDLKDIVNEMEKKLRPSVYGAMIEYIETNQSKEKYLTIQDLFAELLSRYNFAVATKEEK